MTKLRNVIDGPPRLYFCQGIQRPVQPPPFALKLLFKRLQFFLGTPLPIVRFHSCLAMFMFCSQNCYTLPAPLAIPHDAPRLPPKVGRGLADGPFRGAVRPPQRMRPGNRACAPER